MPTTITLEPEVEERLDEIARQTGQDKTTVLKMVIENAIDDIEDYARASEVLLRVREGKEQLFTAQQVRDELGLGD